MKKRINRRALYVFFFITASYAFFVFDLPKRMELKRETTGERIVFQALGPVHLKETKTDAKDRDVSSFIPLVFVFAAIKEGQIEDSYLILVRRGDNISWKKPLDIIRDRDIEGLETLSHILGKAYLERFLEKEGVKIPRGLNAEAIIMGKGYSISESKLFELCEKYLPEEYIDSFSSQKNGCRREQEWDGQKMSVSDERVQEKSEWVMPDLRGYPMKEAVRVLNAYTRRIRIQGFGEVVDQYPGPNERLKGEVECILRGMVN